MSLVVFEEALHLQIEPTDPFQQLKLHNTVLADSSTVVFHEMNCVQQYTSLALDPKTFSSDIKTT